MLIHYSKTFLKSLSCLLYLHVVHSISNAPERYFGGTDNEAYLNWYNNDKSVNYDKSTFLPSNDNENIGAAVHWLITDNDVIHLAVAAKATGWIGFGLTEPGGMKGSDMVIYETANPNKLIDAYVLEDRTPKLDDCQDWKFINAFTDGGYTIFEGVRKLDTEDYQDHAIWDDSDLSILAQRVIAAWGNETAHSFHGPNRSRGSLRWFRFGNEIDLFHQTMDEQADGYFDLLVHNHTLVPDRTDYYHTCFNWVDEITKQGLPADGSVAVIGVEVILDPNAAPYVHHATYHTAPTQNALGNGVCESNQQYQGFLYSWTPGSLPFMFPDNTAMTFGPGPNGDGLVQSFLHVIHYDNPNHVEGVIDNGGVRVYYSNTLREHEVGLFPLGDLATARRGETIGGTGEVSEYIYDCPSDCSQFVLQEPVTVIGEYFHMHEVGKAAYNEQIRNGQVIRKTYAEFFDFDQAGHLGVRFQPYEILPGDAFRTVCYFDGDDGRVFGDGSNEEMCQSYIIYYPAQRFIGGIAPWVCLYDLPFTPCAAVGEDQIILNNDTPFPRSFGASKDQCLALPGSSDNEGDDNNNSDDDDDDDGSGSTTSYDVFKAVTTGIMALAAAV